MGRLGAIILAAGGSTRLGRPKQLLVYRGRTLVERAVSAIADAGCEEIVVVLGRDAAECQQLLPAHVTTVLNAEWERGMGRSLRLGACALSDRVDRAFILLCDQPAITKEVLLRLLDRMDAKTVACVSTFEHTAGPPVLVNRELLEQLRNWPDEEGAKRLWSDPRLTIERVDVPEAAVDIDTEADVARLLEARP